MIRPGPERSGPASESIPADDLRTRYERLLAENFALREKVRNLEEDIEALHWDIKLRRMRSPWRELPVIRRRLRALTHKDTRL